MTFASTDPNHPASPTDDLLWARLPELLRACGVQNGGLVLHDSGEDPQPSLRSACILEHGQPVSTPDSNASDSLELSQWLAWFEAKFGQTAHSSPLRTNNGPLGNQPLGYLLADTDTGRYAPLLAEIVAQTWRNQDLQTQLERLVRDLNAEVELRRTSELAHQERSVALKVAALSDGLTGVANRHAFDRFFEAQITQHRTDGQPLSVIMLDLDHFKLFNDTYGHRRGDECLRKVGKMIGHCVRHPEDMVARFGGEEFVLVLAATDRAGSERVIERLMRGLEQLAIPHEANPGGWVTSSVGVCTLLPASSTAMESTATQIIDTVDAALYRAKQSGRNRVCRGELGEVTLEIKMERKT